MSQQATAGQGAGHGRGRKPKYYPQGRGIEAFTKGYKSLITEITHNTFNTGQNKFTAKFTQSCKNMVNNYLQRMSAAEGCLVAETFRTGKKQIINLPPAMDPNMADVDDQNIIRVEEQKLEE
jgi:hypothetical protein